MFSFPVRVGRMIALSWLQSIAAVLLGVLLVVSGELGLAAHIERQRDLREGGMLAFKLATEIDSFYASACSPGAFCSVALDCPPGFSVSLSGANVSVSRNGAFSWRVIGSPVPRASSRLDEGASCLVLEWDG